MLSQETVRRLLHDISSLQKTPLHDNGIHYIHDESNILKGSALIIGSEDTPYFGGFYFFDFHYPTNYPLSPPVVTFRTNTAERIRFHPNFYASGKVCLSILNTWVGEPWSSCQSISSILLTMCMAFIKEPFLNEPGIYPCHPEYHLYHRIVEYKNIENAICDIVGKNPAVYNQELMSPYDSIVRETFIRNREKLLEWVTDRLGIARHNSTVCIYNMHNILIDYSLLRVKLIQLFGI